MQRMLVTLALVLSANLVIQQSAHAVVYRWVDDQGVVHFAEQAPSGVEATAVDIRPTAVSSIPAIPASVEPGLDEPAATAEGQAEEFSYAETRRRERAESRRLREEETSRNQADCELMRSQLAKLESRPGVLVTGEDGSPRRLLDEERQEMLNKASAFVSANCN